MPFSISDFVRVNRVYFIWVIFAALLYLFRDMFGLLFITYIMCFITSSITHALRRRFRWNRMNLTGSMNCLMPASRTPPTRERSRLTKRSSLQFRLSAAVPAAVRSADWSPIRADAS